MSGLDWNVESDPTLIQNILLKEILFCDKLTEMLSVALKAT